MATLHAPVAEEMGKKALTGVSQWGPIETVYSMLRSGRPAPAIILTFSVNMCLGAFLSTTLTGVIPGIGVIGPVAVTVLRGFLIGMIYPPVLEVSTPMLMLGVGTLILELGGYVFSAAAGMGIAISTLRPRLFNASSRMGAFKAAWAEAARIYVLVATLLAAGAVWEITGLFVLM
ncbi:MAG: hypothetical protein QW390_01490 [Candidatus Bathyarchaeia archaeon]